MASPITWRNVDAPSNVGVSQLFNGAQNGINSGFDHIGEVLKQREQMDQTNWNQQKTNNTQTFMDALGETKTPEEFQAKQAFLANMRNSMGAQIDAPAARAAEDARLGILQNRAVTNNTFNASMDAEHDRPIQDQISEAIYNNDPIKALALKEQLKRGLGDVAKNIDARQEQLLGRDRAGKEFSFKEKDAQYKAEDQDMEKKLFPLKEAQLRTSGDVQRAHADLLRAQAADVGTSKDAAKVEKMMTKLQAAQEKDVKENNLFGQMPNDPVMSLPDHLKVVNDVLGKDKPEVAAKVIKYLNSAHLAPWEDKDGRKVQGFGIPTAVLKKALSSTKDTSSWYEGNNQAANIIEDIKNQMKDPRVASDASVMYEMRARSLNPFGVDSTQGNSEPRDVRPTIAPITREIPAPTPAATPAKKFTLGETLRGIAAGELAPTTGSSPLSSLLSGKAPTLSVPIASNVGKAPSKVAASETLSVGQDGSHAVTSPLDIPKGSLGKPTQVVSAYEGAIPKGKGQRVVATFGNITDGDTVDFKSKDGAAFTCRLDAIDSPETPKPKYGKPGQPGGEEAKKYLQDMIANKEVNVLVTGADTKGRDLCQIEIEGVGVDLEMVKAGMGFLYQEYVSKDSPRRPALEAAEKDARDNRRGIFQQKNPEYPEIFRRRINAP